MKEKINISVISFLCLFPLSIETIAKENFCDETSNPIKRSDNCKCRGHMICTLDWNRGLLYQLEAIGVSDGFGHCIDPRQSPYIDGPAIQADFDDLQQLHETIDTNWTAPRLAIPCHFPDRSEIRVDQAIIISFKAIINGNGATIRTSNNTAGGLVFKASS